MNYPYVASDLFPSATNMSQYGDNSNPFGDYYFEEEAVTRGVTFHHEVCMSADVDPFNLEKDTYVDHVHSEFANTAEPRDVPFGGVASTSFRVRSVDAFRALHDFLQGDLTGLVTKTSQVKYSVTAEIVLDVRGSVLQCEVKGRLFRARAEETSPTDSSRLVMELTRRSGDALAFAEVFRRAVASLAAESVEARCSYETDAIAVPAEMILDGHCMQPLVDTVQAGTSPECQAEALASLLALTKSPAAAEELFMACANLQSILVQLATSPLFQVSYLAARLNTWHQRRACGLDEFGTVLGSEFARLGPAVA